MRYIEEKKDMRYIEVVCTTLKKSISSCTTLAPLFESIIFLMSMLSFYNFYRVEPGSAGESTSYVCKSVLNVFCRSTLKDGITNHSICTKCVFFLYFTMHLLYIYLELWIVFLIGLASAYVRCQVYDPHHICLGIEN